MNSSPAKSHRLNLDTLGPVLVGVFILLVVSAILATMISSIAVGVHRAIARKDVQKSAVSYVAQYGLSSSSPSSFFRDAVAIQAVDDCINHPEDWSEISVAHAGLFSATPAAIAQGSLSLAKTCVLRAGATVPMPMSLQRLAVPSR